MTTKITSANIDTTSVATATSANTANFNIALLGFKMAITEGLTVFNLIDGIVDEFEDESGVDNSASTTLLYNSTDDYYINSTTPQGLTSPAGGITSAGFTTTTITEPDTSTAGTNPAYGNGTAGEYTVPSGITSLTAFVFGSGGGGGDHGSPGSSIEVVGGGGGGFATGNISVTPGQVFDIRVGEGGIGLSPSNQTRSFGGGGNMYPGATNPLASGGGGGFSGIFSNSTPITNGPGTPTGITPQIYIIAGSGGGGGGHLSGVSTAFNNNVATGGSFMYGGSGGGLTGKAGGINFSQTDSTTAGSTPQSPLGPIPATLDHKNGGGGSQTTGGQGASGTNTNGDPGGFLFGGGIPANDVNIGNGGSGYYGGGAGGYGGAPQQGSRGGGGGSSYYGNPALSSTSTTAGDGIGEGGGVSNPNYSAGTNEGVQATPLTAVAGEDGFILLLNSAVCASVTSSTIISDPFSASTVPTTTRMVVFEENVDSPTLNTDIIASVSRNGGTNFTTVTLSDSGYITGSSGQRILTGQASISGQPSGQSMKWKLELANQTVKIHGVSLQWS